MRLFSEHQGKNAIDVSFGANIDAVASITDNTVYLHIANTSMTSSEEIILDLGDKTVESAKMFCIAEDPETEITPQSIGCFKENVTEIIGKTVTVPKASVAAIEIKIK